jgi:hypothetical protein
MMPAFLCVRVRSAVLPLIVIASAGASGCAQTTVSFITEVMPGRTAELDAEARELTISRGAAIAFECTEFTDDWNGACRDFTVDSDDTDTADVLGAFLAQPAGVAQQQVASSDGSDAVQGAIQRTGGVVVANKKGNAHVTVTSQSGAVELTVKVIDPVQRD